MSQPTNNSEPPSYLDKGIGNLHQFIGTLFLHKKAIEFIQEQKPWKGLGRLGWILWVMVIAGALLSYQFYKEIAATVHQMQTEHLSFSTSMASVFSFEKMAWVVHGSRKYLIMVVMELVVFYIIQRTLEIRTGRIPDLTTRAFIEAEYRILSSTILAWIFETFTRFLVVNLALGILGFDWLKQPTSFLIQSYFLGFAMVDNYHECFHLNVSQSEKRTRKLAMGVALGTGMIAQLLMYVPMFGAFAETVLGAVAATLAMERYAPVSDAEHILILAEQQKRKEKKARAKHASQ